jgi:hypothetical protein
VRLGEPGRGHLRIRGDLRRRTGVGPFQCLDVIGHVTVASAVPTLYVQQAQHQHRYAEHLPKAGHDRLDLRPPRDVDREGPDGPEILLVPGHQHADGSAHVASLR